MPSLPQDEARFNPPLAGQVAVVTGSSRGIGRAIACELSAQGAAVVVHGRNSSEHARETVQQLSAAGATATLLTADLADAPQLEGFVEAAWNWRGRVDIWINNAGADVLTGDAAKWSFEEKLERLWQVDVLGAMRLSRLVGPRMQQQGGGAIVNIGWDQAEQGMAGDAGQMFGAIKGAVMALTRSLAQTYAPSVRVNCVAPGWIKTAWGDQASAAWQARATEESLRRRWGTADDVARAVCFAASPSADFITGQIIAVNGGFRHGRPELSS